jgi:hypothetical protein
MNGFPIEIGKKTVQELCSQWDHMCSEEQREQQMVAHRRGPREIRVREFTSCGKEQESTRRARRGRRREKTHATTPRDTRREH